MCVNNLPKVATQWNSGATQDSNHGRQVLIPSVLTTRPLSHTNFIVWMNYFAFIHPCQQQHNADGFADEPDFSFMLITLHS